MPRKMRLILAKDQVVAPLAIAPHRKAHIGPNQVMGFIKVRERLTSDGRSTPVLVVDVLVAVGRINFVNQFCSFVKSILPMNA